MMLSLYHSPHKLGNGNLSTFGEREKKKTALRRLFKWCSGRDSNLDEQGSSSRKWGFFGLAAM